MQSFQNKKIETKFRKNNNINALTMSCVMFEMASYVSVAVTGNEITVMIHHGMAVQVGHVGQAIQDRKRKRDDDVGPSKRRCIDTDEMEFNDMVERFSALSI